MPTALAPIDLNIAVVDTKTGVLSDRWRWLMQQLFGDLSAVTALPAIINRNGYVALNALGLGVADAGYLAFEPVYGHLLRWTGAVWEFAPGDVGNKFRRDFLGAPQEVGWALMDGSATDYLVVGGALLTVTAITPPNLTGTPSFHKSIAAYTGTLEAAIAPGLSGTTAGAGILGTSSQSDDIGASVVAAGVGATVIGTLRGTAPAAVMGHAHTIADHTHGLGSIAADTAGRPPSVGWLPYFKR